MAEVGDLVIILSYVDVEDSELADHRPAIVFVDEENRVVDGEQ
jgi:aspartate 1-decarboxylase